MIDVRHPLAMLAIRMPWAAVESPFAPLLAHKDRDGRSGKNVDLFGPKEQIAGAGLSNAERARLDLRVVVALPHLCAPST